MNTNNSEKKWFRPVFDFMKKISSQPEFVKPDQPLNAPLTNPTSSCKSLSSLDFPDLNFEDVQSDNWIDKFAPQEVTDLAVNVKKTQEVQEWLNKAIGGRSMRRGGPMLLLTGPSGCGKTITIQLLAKKFGSQISEWVTPIDVEYFKDLGPNSYTYQERQSEKFKDFLLKSSSYSSLLSCNDVPRTLLVEDFPNSFLKDPADFVNILQTYHERGKSPLIFICTDTRDGGLNLLWNLFPPAVQEKFGIQQISFNPVAPTSMKSALKRVSLQMSKKYSSLYTVPNQECVDSIINSSMGDVRSAVNNLHFASLKGGVGIQISHKRSKEPSETNGRKRKKKNETSKLNSIGKDETISIMHGVGRVLNPKKAEKLSAKDGDTFTHSPQSIVDLFQMQPASFVAYIHENFLPHFSDISHIEKATEALSDADCFLNDWREKDGKLYGLSVAIGGIMVANKAPVSSWHPIKGPKNMKITFPTSKEIPLLEENQLIQGKILATDYETFCKIISKT